MKTPYYVFDKAELLNELGKLNEAIKLNWPQTIVAYSVKTNSLPFLAKTLNENGVYAEVVSEDEYDMVSLCGYSPSNIICNGPVKSFDFVGKLLDGNVVINIDSHAELQHVVKYAIENRGKKYGVGLRVNVDIERYFPSESKAGEQGSRFGFCMENNELEKAIELLQSYPNIYIRGLHLHVSTSTRKVEIYEWLSSLFSLLIEKYNLSEIEYFDIGGGFFGGMPNKPNWNDYLSAIGNVLRDKLSNPEKITLILEPGVGLLAGSFKYYTSVVDVKKTNRSTFVVTDGSRIHIDPLFHKTGYFFKHLREGESVSGIGTSKQIIVGFTCLEYDNIMTLENWPKFDIGDVLCFDKLGAYTMTLSPLFISYFPAVYVENNDGTMKCVRRKWTANEFVQLSELD